MKYALTTLLTLFAITANAQTISFSPTSIPLWGSIENTMKASIEYKDVELVAVRAMEAYHDRKGSPSLFPELGIEDSIFEEPGEYSGYYFGLFYTPLEVEWKGFTVEGGAGFWSRRFPTKNGTRFNFNLSLSYMISDNFSISFSHISNGFNLLYNDKINPGIDHLSIRYHF